MVGRRRGVRLVRVCLGMPVEVQVLIFAINAAPPAIVPFGHLTLATKVESVMVRDHCRPLVMRTHLGEMTSIEGKAVDDVVDRVHVAAQHGKSA